MTGSFDGNERAIGAHAALDTLRNLLTESPNQAFERGTLLALIADVSDTLAGAYAEVSA